MKFFVRYHTPESEIRLMRRTLLECSQVIDQLHADKKELLLRGNRIVDALDTNDGTIPSAWKVSNAVAAWREFAGVAK